MERTKRMTKKLLAALLTLAMTVPCIATAIQMVKAADSTDPVVNENGVKYIWYEDISTYRVKDEGAEYYTASPAQSGYVFGGWFCAADDTTTIGTATSGGAWAKFVPEETFTIKGQIGLAEATEGAGFEDILDTDKVQKVNLRLITGVDSLQYQKVVFHITHQSRTIDYDLQTVLKKIDVKTGESSALKSVTPESVFGEAAGYFATIKITNIANVNNRYKKVWRVTPQIVTMDGTVVSGVTRSNLRISSAMKKRFSTLSQTTNVTADEWAGEVSIAGKTNVVNTIYFASEAENHKSLYWKMTGTVRREAGKYSAIGFKVSDGTNEMGYWFKSWGVNVGNNSSWETYSALKGSGYGNVYFFNMTDNSYKKFSDIKNPPALDTISFEITVENDVLTAYFGGDKIWVLPLTNEMFGGFTAGSEYKVGFTQVDAVNVYFENVTVLSDANEANTSNVEVFQIDEEQGTYGTTTAVIDEMAGTIKKNSANRETLYFANESQTWEIKGTMSQENLSQWIPQGFAVRDVQTGKSRGFLGERDGFVVYSQSWVYYNRVATNNNTVNGYRKYLLEKTSSEYTKEPSLVSRKNTDISFRVVVKDDVMYVFLNDVLSWRIPLTFSNMGGFTPGSEYQLGVCWTSDTEAGAATTNTGFKITSVKTGADADISGIVKYILSDITSGMESNAVTGKISVEVTDESTTEAVYFATDETDNSSSAWQIEGTFVQGSTEIEKGFIIRSSDGEKTYYKSFADDVNSSVIFKALMKEDVFYVWLDGELAWKLSLTDEQYGGFEAGTSYYLGLYNSGDRGAEADWSELNVKYGTNVQTTDFYIRDPYVLLDGDTYYMYGTRYGGSYDVFTSRDLVTWERQERCFVAEDDFWGGNSNYWAPEVYKYTYNGETAYYMFATFLGSVAEDGNPAVRGTAVLKAGSPLGPFTEWSDGALTPKGHDCLDGTLYIEDGVPYMIYCHEFSCDNSSCGDNMGSMAYVRLSPDLKTTAGDYVDGCFLAKDYTDYNWFEINIGGKTNAVITDGPFVHTTADGQKYLLWSTYVDNDYLQIATPFKITTLSGGFDVKKSTLLYGQGTIGESGGHGMTFTDRKGRDILVLFNPNLSNNRLKFFQITKENGTLSLSELAEF